ncbi:MAG: deoxyribonuclease IV [Bacteriovoracaceae bacterium]|nr:deoxyribonuclease IV [Bacteriovoracaceae bacterium]
MKYFGAHVSIAGGVENAPERAAQLGANAFAMFSKNQRQWSSRPYTKSQIQLFKDNLAKYSIQPDKVLVHDSYLINLGSPNEATRSKSLQAFKDEALRVNQLGLSLLNFHPGAHLNKIPEQQCFELIAQGLNETIQETDNVIFVIENTAGQGSNLGFRFEQIKNIIELVKDKKRIGVCIDTCHAYAAGYDLAKSKKSFTDVFDDFEKIIGFKYLKGMHLNDSKMELNSHRDRHESIGLGTIGKNCFKWIAKDKRFDDIPLILETPEKELWEDELKMLQGFAA